MQLWKPASLKSVGQSWQVEDSGRNRCYSLESEICRARQQGKTASEKLKQDFCVVV